MPRRRRNITNLIMSLILVFSLVGCTRNSVSNIQLSEAPSATITPALDSVEAAEVGDDDITRIDDIDKLDQ